MRKSKNWIPTEDENRALIKIKRYLVESHEVYNEQKLELYSALEQLKTVKEKAQHVRITLKGFYETRVLLEKYLHLASEPKDRYDVFFNGLDVYDTLIDFCEHQLSYYKRIAELDGDILENNRTIKVKWNGQKKSLTNLFHQLKNIHTQDRMPVIGNSYEELADFLQQNFECYRDTAYTTILGELKKGVAPKKTDGKVMIHV